MAKTTLAVIKNETIGKLGDVTLQTGAVSVTFILGTVIRIMVILGAVIMVFFLIIGALNWITAEGKPDKLEGARNTIIHAIVGMIVLAAAVAITSFIGGALNIPFLQTLKFEIPTL